MVTSLIQDISFNGYGQRVNIGLVLSGEWNQEIMQHLGRHPNEYHEFILHTLEQIDQEAAGEIDTFLMLFNLRILLMR